MKIELLYFDDCPSWARGLINLKSALELEGIQADVELIKVVDQNDAARLKFLGSPHFRVNGHDLWPEARENYSFSCRVYPTPAGFRGHPTAEMLREQIRPFKGI